MPVVTPGRRPAYPPIGRLRSSPLSGGGKKSMFVSLNLTPMVDMFTILVVFLIQLFTADTVTLNDRIKVPKSVAGTPLEDPGTVVMISDELLLLDGGTIPDAEMGTELDIPIPGMVDRLRKQREFREQIEGRDPNSPYDGLLIIQADVKTDFRRVRRVIASANEAGWAKFKFVTTPEKKKDAPAEG